MEETEDVPRVKAVILQIVARNPNIHHSALAIQLRGKGQKVGQWTINKIIDNMVDHQQILRIKKGNKVLYSLVNWGSYPYNQVESKIRRFLKEEKKEIDRLLTSYAHLSQFEKISMSINSLSTLLENLKTIEILSVTVEGRKDIYGKWKEDIRNMIINILDLIKADRDEVIYSAVISSLLKINPPVRIE